MRKIIAIISGALLLLAFACKMPERKNNGHAQEKFFTTTAGNIFFIFPQDSAAYNDREKLISECQDAIKSDIQIVKFPSFTDSIVIQFVSSREEMKKYARIPASGVTLLIPKIVYLLYNAKEVGSPIKHELMHMIMLCALGYPDQTSFWMHEGIAAYSQNECNSYNDEQIYRFLLEDKLLLPMDSLTAHFYMEPEMIAYHQSAFMVQYLLLNYGIEKFKVLWTQGFANFEKVYGISFANAKAKIDSTAKHDYPNAPPIVWKTFSEGCQ